MTVRLRIAVLGRNFSSRGGGAERYGVELADALAQAHEVHVFAQHFEQAPASVQCHTVAMPWKRPRWINQLYFAWATWRATHSGFDHVISHENTWHGDVQVVHVLPIRHNLLAGRTGIRRLLRWIKVATSPRLLAYLWLERRRYRPEPGRKIVVTSQTLRGHLVAAYPASEPMVHVIPPGLHDVPGPASAQAKAGARQALGLPAKVPVLLFVGNDFRKKGLPALLDAMSALPPEVHLLVVGEGRQMAQMRTLAQALQGRVRFAGSLADVGPAYRAADLLVHPTLEDTYAMVVLEAMAHGLPVVVSQGRYCGIAAELLPSAGVALLQDPLDAAALAACLQDMLARQLPGPGPWEDVLGFASARTWRNVAHQFAGLLGAEAP